MAKVNILYTVDGVQIFGQNQRLLNSVNYLKRLIELVSSESWKGKAGAYDLAGAASQDTRLVEGEEVTVLGFAPSAISKLESI